MIFSLSDFVQNPTLVVLVPFAWLLWQLYLPRIIPNYETWWTNTKKSLKQELRSLDSRMDSIAHDVSDISETQDKLVNVTVAQSHKMNGYEGEMDIETVKEDLLDSEKDFPRDYLKDDN